MTEKQIEQRARQLIDAGMDAEKAIDQALDEAVNGITKKPENMTLAERIAAKKAQGNTATATATATKAVKATPAKAKEKAKSKMEIADDAFETMPETITVTLYKYTFSTESKGYRTPENVMVADSDGNEFALAKANLVILDTRRK